jgi:hypothetical protein
VTIAVITGGRDRIPTLAELVTGLDHLRDRGATIVRHGAARGTDKAVAAWLAARTDLVIEPWPAEDYGEWPWCGAKRNRAMLDGDGGPDLFGMFERPRADFLVAFEGNEGTTDCKHAARVERGIPVDVVAPVLEPRIWNRHHGTPPGPGIYVGGNKQNPCKASPLANPWADQIPEGKDRAAEAVRVLDMYKQWLWARINPKSVWYDRRIVELIRGFTPEHYLVCSCWPLDCHAEIILAAWRWLNSQAS